MVAPVAIAPLSQQPQWLPLLAEWQQAQWRRHSPTGSVAQRQRKLHQHLSGDGLPISFVGYLPASAEQPAQPIGCVSLVTYQFGPGRPRSPWLANLLVLPAWRGAGIGSQLLAHAVTHARQLQLPRLFLYTHDQRAFYEARGWHWLRQQQLSGDAVDVMGCRLAI